MEIYGRGFKSTNSVCQCIHLLVNVKRQPLRYCVNGNVFRSQIIYVQSVITHNYIRHVFISFHKTYLRNPHLFFLASFLMPLPGGATGIVLEVVHLSTHQILQSLLQRCVWNEELHFSQTVWDC